MYGSYRKIKTGVPRFWATLYNVCTMLVYYTEWQSCVIGLLLFSIAFGLLGTILCTCGVCVESIYMKMYYFHSAAEVYFICGMTGRCLRFAEKPLTTYGTAHLLALSAKASSDVSAPAVWNSLSFNCRSCKLFSTFAHMLKTELNDTAYSKHST